MFMNFKEKETLLNYERILKALYLVFECSTDETSESLWSSSKLESTGIDAEGPEEKT